MKTQPWHTRSTEDVVQELQTDLQDGLSTKQAQERLNEIGYNEIRAAVKKTWWQTLLLQFQDFMVLVLLGATLISAFLGEYTDALTILLIVFLNAVLGFIQEYRAEKSLEALKTLAAPTASIIRNGMVQQVAAREVVPGDLLWLEAGQKIPADARLIDGHQLEVDESPLTGESIPVRKKQITCTQPDQPLGDRFNMVYAGTAITRGRGTAIVCSTGMNTEMGQIADLIQSVQDEETPLQRRLRHLGQYLVWLCLSICILVVITGIWKGESLLLMCMAGISLAVAAIPEGLPAIVTVSLALGVQQMIKRKAIVRKLPAVETLGCVTAICSDKTGTLTQNKMTLQQIYIGTENYKISGLGYEVAGNFSCQGTNVQVDQNDLLKQFLYFSVLCNNSIIKHGSVVMTGLWRNEDKEMWSIEGDPTEGALIIAAAKAGIWRDQLEKEWKRLAEVPFESERRRMSVVYKNKLGEAYLIVKGAPDVLIDCCDFVATPQGVVPLSADRERFWLDKNSQLANQALRVLAVAYRKLSLGELDQPDQAREESLILLGLGAMMDPPREEARHAIGLCRQAGIKPIMITGDHPSTALAVAHELTLLKSHETFVMTGPELDQLSDSELEKKVLQTSVYARVSPTHKLRIVKALKSKGHITAMTGDGINDAPAMKEADIGIAMGLTGTDVAKEASAMILVDDNFATIVAAIEEGRAIYDNIRKFIRYLLACNTGEVLTMFFAALVALPLPLLPVQILWVNLVTDGLPALALGIDPKDQHIMYRPPRRPKESVFSRGLGLKILWRGMMIGFMTLAVFYWAYIIHNDLALARTMAFTTLVFCQLFHVFDCRSEMLSIFEAGWFKNKALLLAVACSIMMQLGALYIPTMQQIFSTVPLQFDEWIIILLAAGFTTLLGGVKHWLWKRRSQSSVFSRI